MRQFLACLVAAACVAGVTALLLNQIPPDNPPDGAPAPVHPCAPGDFYMQCARPGLPQVAPPLAPHAQRGVFGYGVDFAWSCPLPAGASFGASYLSPDRSKNWTRGCVDAYHRTGRKTVVVWESSAARAAAGYGAGAADARAAVAQAAALGKPADRPIYFAVDFDTSPNPGAILPYFRGVVSVLGVARTGGYGGIATIRALFNAGLVRYGWQTAAWSRGQWDGRVQLQQYGFSGALDWDRATAADYGQWPHAAPKPPKPKPPPPPSARARHVCAFLRHFRRQHRRSSAWERANYRVGVRFMRRHHLSCEQARRPHVRRV